MRQWLTIFLYGFLLSACSAPDKVYYMMHPKALEQAILRCDTRPPLAAPSCKALHVLAKRMNQLAYELQRNQLDYGQTILTLQHTRAMTANASQRKALDEQLQIRLAVVNWLASPGRSR